MSIGLDFKDTATIIDPVIDEYGTEKIGRAETVALLFVQRTSGTHTNNQDEIETDAVAYLDPADSFLTEKNYRIEEMLLITGYGSTEDNWYKIVDVNIAQDKLLNNEIEHLYVRLKKTVPIEYVS